MENIKPDSDLDRRTIQHHKDGETIRLTFPSKEMKDAYAKDELSAEMSKWLSEQVS